MTLAEMGQRVEHISQIEFTLVAEPLIGAADKLAIEPGMAVYMAHVAAVAPAPCKNERLENSMAFSPKCL
ncbi:hypothetical protein GCM10007895_23640 [Paraferrimonas sedimenticola]|uniref:Uncharacterized protein n=1 Tax=Paraferrimonas sedimenticola TaxID=375674 RepID=A0AA37RXT0_9GAMM|nr:hypothetical protein GCM10007895_23640 [Paraferrimonas sedimenticola]